MNSPATSPAWMRGVLTLAGLYNLTWGALVVLLPGRTFEYGGLLQPGHAAVDPRLWQPLWQCIGMIVGVYGVGYWIAARDPVRHWPIVLVGLLGKVLGPIGALNGALQGDLPWSILWTNLTNDLVWWVPFALILAHAWRASQVRGSSTPPV